MMNDRNDQIINLYLNNPELSIKDIANRFSISTATVSRIARLNNLPRRTGNSGVKLSQQEINSIKQEYLTVKNIYTGKNKTPKYMKQKLIEFKRKIDSTII